MPAAIAEYEKQLNDSPDHNQRKMWKTTTKYTLYTTH